MDMGDAVGDEVNDLAGSIDDSGLLHGSGVVPELVYYGPEPLGHVSAGESHASLQLPGVGYRHYSGQHRYGDTFFPYAVEEVVQNIVVEEHLGGEEVAAGLHLLLKMDDVVLFMPALDMSLWIAGATDAQV